jgi:diguanylate cyclase (GGDEF)-like protein/PAS domain S-box-containing protein
VICAPSSGAHRLQAALGAADSGAPASGPRRLDEHPRATPGRAFPTDDEGEFATLHGEILRVSDGETELSSFRRETEGVPPEPPRVGHAADSRDAQTLSSLDDAIFRLDPSGRLEFMNPAAVGLCGRELAVGFPLAHSLELVDERTRQPVPNLVALALAERRPAETSDATLLARPDGSEVAVRGTATPLLDGDGLPTGAVLVLRDVARAKQLERELEYLARHDSLTGLLNRREFERRLAEAISAAGIEHGEHTLLYLDLDQFKLVNDTCGHLAGDRLLQQISQLLGSRLRRRDCLARLGGDEFGILLHDCGEEASDQIAEEIRELVRGCRFQDEGHTFDIGASIGLVPVTATSGDLTDVLRAADAACYVVKDAGGNGVHRFSLDDTAIGRRQTEMFWVQRVQKALGEDRLRLHYQMIQPIGGEGLETMCELFVRLVDRDGTLHRASSFVPAAERFGLMPELDRWVVRTAFRAIAEANANRLGAESSWRPAVDSFSINLSAYSLSSESFLDFVLDELATAGFPPEKVCFEITETAAISNLAHARRMIGALKEVGCRFALDDFGRGLSSFAYLKDLKVDLLKIDADFIQGIASDTVNRAMVASIRQVAQVMGLTTIAEGVEDEATLVALREIGVEYAQGEFVHRPEAVLREMSSGAQLAKS